MGRFPATDERFVFLAASLAASTDFSKQVGWLLPHGPRITADGVFEPSPTNVMTSLLLPHLLSGVKHLRTGLAMSCLTPALAHHLG